MRHTRKGLVVLLMGVALLGALLGLIAQERQHPDPPAPMPLPKMDVWEMELPDDPIEQSEAEIPTPETLTVYPRKLDEAPKVSATRSLPEIIDVPSVEEFLKSGGLEALRQGKRPISKNSSKSLASAAPAIARPRPAPPNSPAPLPVPPSKDALPKLEVAKKILPIPDEVLRLPPKSEDPNVTVVSRTNIDVKPAIEGKPTREVPAPIVLQEKPVPIPTAVAPKELPTAVQTAVPVVPKESTGVVQALFNVPSTEAIMQAGYTDGPPAAPPLPPSLP